MPTLREQSRQPTFLIVADHTASEHRFGFESFASTGLNTPGTVFPTRLSAAMQASSNKCCAGHCKFQR
jgi:hypothetical protein